VRCNMPSGSTRKNRGLAYAAQCASEWHAPCLCATYAAAQHGYHGIRMASYADGVGARLRKITRNRAPRTAR